jgi:hypothetical protein
MMQPSIPTRPLVLEGFSSVLVWVWVVWIDDKVPGADSVETSEKGDVVDEDEDSDVA